MSVAAEAPDKGTAVAREPVRTRRRLIPRFRLRTLFVAAVLMSLLLGWYGRHVYRVRQERAAAESLRQVGAQLAMPTFDYAGTTFPADLYGLFPWFYVEEHTSVMLDSAKGATDADTQHLARLRGLKSLWLTGDGFTDEALRGAAEARALDDLVLRETVVTGAGLAAFEGREQLTYLRYGPSVSPEPARVLERVDSLPNLELLSTIREPLTVQGMRATAKLERLRRFHVVEATRIEPGAFDALANSPGLEELHVTVVPSIAIGDRELIGICKIESLRTLVLAAPQVTDAGFARLADLPNLRELHVSCPNVTDAGAKALAEIESLERISLNYGVTDASLDSLRHLPNLQDVILPRTISREAAQRFANERMDCEVRHTDPAYPWGRLEPQTSSEETAANETSSD